MLRLLTLSRAARLVGVRRGALQSKIRSGELVAFEGMVSAEDLLRVYPETKLEDNTLLQRIEAIKESAFSRRMRESLLPSSEILVARLAEMSSERTASQARLEHYRRLVNALQEKLLAAQGQGGEQGSFATELLGWLRHREEPQSGEEGTQSLLAQDNFLRIMTAHVQIKPSGRDFFVDGNDTLLEAALRAGLALDYGCSIGSCGKCKARILAGQVHKTRHSDFAITAAKKNAGVVLMCCNTAVGDLVMEAREAHGAADMPVQKIEARVKSVSAVADDMRLLHLQTPRSNRLRFIAGQSVFLALPGEAQASYPVASCPCDDRNLHFHIGRYPGDAFSERVFADLRATDIVRVEGPRGDFVLDETANRPLVFIAIEAGFAPVKSLIEHAMALDSAETMHLYWIATRDGGHYLDNLCRSWGDALDDFEYLPWTLDAALPERAAMERLMRQVLSRHALPETCDFYVAGPARHASAARELLLEGGLPDTRLFVNTLDS